MRKEYFLLKSLCLGIFVYVLPVMPQSGSIPETGFGARALALGQSTLAFPTDALSSSWNPANMVNLKKVTASIFYRKLPQEAINTSAGIVIPTAKHGAFGASAFHFEASFVARTEKNSQSEEEFKQSHLLLTYANHFLNNFAAGFNLKFVTQSLAQTTAPPENIGLDVGILYQVPKIHSILKSVIVGIAVDNLIKPTLKLGEERETLPREARLTLETGLTFGSNSLVFMGNLGFLEKKFFQDNFRLQGGAEYSYKSVVALRVGIRENSFDLGAGVRYKKFTVDYARNQFKSQRVDWTDAISLTYQL